MRLRVVGSSSAVPRPGSACSCYVIETASTTLALDCGTGAVASMRRFLNPNALNAVIISHLHADHVVDLIPLRYFTTLPPTKRDRPLEVYVYSGGLRGLQSYARAASTGSSEKFFETSMRLHEYDPSDVLEIGDVQIRFARTTHYVEAYAVRAACAGVIVAYSADTAPAPNVVQAARNADVFVCECSLGPHGTDRAPRGHSNAREAGIMAAQAQAKHLLLTHYGAEFDPQDLHAAASREFGGPVTVAHDGLQLSF